jgi:glycine hydroxymethyltransferase
MKEAEFELIAHRICDVLDRIDDHELHAKIREEMKELALNFVIYDRPIY